MSKPAVASLPKLPWEIGEYLKLEPDDLNPTPAPTEGQCIRVVCAILTAKRDHEILCGAPPVESPSNEVIRGLLIGDADVWERDVGSVCAFLGLYADMGWYDVVDPHKRWCQSSDAAWRERS